MNNTGCELNMTSRCVGIFNEFQQNADIYCGTLTEIQNYIIDNTDTLKENTKALDAVSYIKSLRDLIGMFADLGNGYEEDEL